MGLLDDAIREHLELKRLHGADPDEVSRQEREALGAPVRGEFAQPAAPAAPGGHEPESEIDEEMGAEELGAEETEAGVPGAVAAGEVAPPDEYGEPEPGTEEDPWLVDDVADEPPPPPPPPSSPPPDRPPASADVVVPDEEPPAEDVLEETPEFLQETPEHERLWFEQKPPRDFDWDK